MGISAAATVAVLLAAEPLDTGLRGVWQGLAFLSLMRLSTLLWRYQSADGPLPLLPAPPPAAKSAAPAEESAAQTAPGSATMAEPIARRALQPGSLPGPANNIVPQQARQRQKAAQRERAERH